MSSYSFKSGGPQTRPDRVKAVPVDRSPAGFRSRSSSTASSASFASAVEAQNGEVEADGAEDDIEPVRFSPEEEKTMVDASHTLKAAANKQFAAKDFSSAISTYDKALAELPIYLDYELAVLQSNIAACHLQLREWKEAIDSAERGLDNLERELPMPKPRKQKDGKNGSSSKEAPENEDKIVELPDDQSEEQTTEALKNLTMSDQRKQDILRIRTKLLLRRARAKVMLCETPPPSAPKPASYLDPDHPLPSSDGPPPPKKTSFGEAGSRWSNLSTALGDYQTLAEPTYFHILPSSDQKTVIEMLRTLPPRVEAAKKKEVDEMMGKLKELGNGILKPFGLSTDMFKMVQDPNTGGYSINFDQKGGK